MKHLILAILVVGMVLLGACAAPSTTPVIQPEPIIPAHFTTYTDEASLFSISYPSDWEPVLSVIEEAEQATKDLIRSIDSDLPVERVSVIFMAGEPSEIGLIPSIPSTSIVVEPVPGIMWTHDQMVESEIKGIKEIVQDYHEFSRVKTTIDNRTATIIVWQGTIPQRVTGRYVLMMFLVGKTIWIVTCLSLPENFSLYENDFNAIVRSLHILK